MSESAKSASAHSQMFEELVEELLKDKPDAKKVKSLCTRLGINYCKNHLEQIDDLIKNGSKIYLNGKDYAKSI